MEACPATDPSLCAPPPRLIETRRKGWHVQIVPISVMNNTIQLFRKAACAAVVLLGVAQVHAANTQTVTLVALDGSNASGQVVITSEANHSTLVATVSGLTPNAVHSLWLLLDAASPPFIVDPTLGLAVVTDDNLATLAAVLPVSPAAADNAGYKAGTGLDPNGFVTNSKGEATFTVRVNYDVTMSQIAPVVLAPLTQKVEVEPVTGPGECKASPGSTFLSFIDSGYVRKYDTSRTEASFQLHDGSYRAKLVRGTVASLVVVQHLDNLTHGHAPGVMTVVSGCGDHMGKLTGNVAH